MQSIFKKIITAIMRSIARRALAVHHPKVIAVTGSVGKTSTKEAIAAVLSAHHTVRKSEKSFNSEIGVPLSILGLGNAWSSVTGWIRNIVTGMGEVGNKDFPEWLVLEVGVDHPGDIAKTASWVAADMVVFTRFPDVPVHVEFFSSPEAVIEEKLQLLHSLAPQGTVLVNADDPKTNVIEPRPGQSKVSYGFSPSATIKAESAAIAYENGKPAGMRLRVIANGANHPITIPGNLGDASVYSALAALSVTHALGESIPDAIKAIEALTPIPGRMRIIDAKNGACIIDDTYNASPVATFSAVDTMGSISATGRKIVAFADMKELGQFSEEEHIKIGKRVARLYAERKLHYFYTVGSLAALSSKSAVEAGMPVEAVAPFSNADDLAEHLSKMIGQGDIVLIKGSQSMRMERATKKLMANPEKAAKLLVRQDEGWQKR